MTDQSECERLFEPVVRRFQAEPLAFDAQDFAMLTSEDHFCCHIHAPRNSRDLNLFVLLGHLPEVNRENLVVYAMGSNWLNGRTRGSVLSVAGEDDTLVLQRHLSRAETTPEQLETIVAGMKRVAEIWRAIFKRAEEEREAAGAASNRRPFDPAALNDAFTVLNFV